LYIQEGEQLVIDQFDRETKKVKIKILKCLAKIGSEISEDFLSKVILNKTFDKDIRLEAMYSLNQINLNFDEVLFDKCKNSKKMISHVKNQYI
jgi:hypothetical protein